MIAQATSMRRFPRVLQFLLASLIQTGLIAWMVYDRAGILRAGTEVTLQTRPIDPRDFLRGDYVVLNYDISSLPSGALKDTAAAGAGTPIYVKLAPKDGVHAPVSVHKDPVPVTGDEVLIRGRVNSGASCGTTNRMFCETLQIKYGIERFFVPEGEGKVIEQSRNQGKVQVVAAVTPSGRAAIKRLLMDGKPVYDEPLY
ncbi:MAG: hypothetical protein QOC56_972 [Alphaproteobacteria bacterium]|jgi:uncharacterized membrane-anchored protein|nr:hypothetical protein [Alphaproteobacteria bacterium]